MSDARERPKIKNRHWWNRRSKSPQPQAATTEATNSATSDASQDPTQNLDVNEKPDNLQASAYHVAWSSLNAKDKAKLSDKSTIDELFQSLDDANKQHSQSSGLRRGLHAADPYLSFATKAIEFANPAISLQPGAGAAAGVVTGALKVGTFSSRLWLLTRDQARQLPQQCCK